MNSNSPSQTTALPTLGFADEWLMWQLADSAFPTGGFAHSGGLEAAVQTGAVPDVAALEAFCRVSLTQLARQSLPLLRAVHAEPERLPTVDRQCEAMLSNHVANRASRSQGRALLLAAERAFAHGRPAVGRLRDRVRQERLPGHLAPLFGAVAAAMGLDGEASARLFTFTATRDLISAAVRLNVVGPLQAQALQHALGEAAAAAIAHAPVDAMEAASAAPVLELLQARQDRLYSRLFHS
ncbi:urease accessory protein UreF [Phycisphaerales bacterium AB-hyl4]|uniref:Urease accessory protein UreF n=1 Tax=Natronomicrosphaera hydrolytica TaxID=3242702 RepID=A0ABV4U290_9BACT